MPENGCSPACRDMHMACHTLIAGIDRKITDHIGSEEADVKVLKLDVSKMGVAVGSTNGKLNVLLWILGIAATGLTALAVGTFLLVLERIP